MSPARTVAIAGTAASISLAVFATSPAGSGEPEVVAATELAP